MYPPSTTKVKQFEISVDAVEPLIDDTTSEDKHVFKPTTVKVVNKPLPAGIVAPTNEKPRTVEPPEETVKPFSAAAPPDALTSVTPSTLNWKPPISIELL